MSAMLVVQMNDGRVCAVRFPTATDARDWEDAHETEIAGTVLGVALYPCTRRELLTERNNA